MIAKISTVSFKRNIAILLASLVMLNVLISGGVANGNSWPRQVQHEQGTLDIASKPMRIVSTSPSLTGVLLAIDSPLLATAATTPSILTDHKGFFTQWAKIADQRNVEILYPNLEFDLEAIIALQPDLVIGSSTGADSIVAYYSELQAQGIPVIIVNYANQSWQEIARKVGYATGCEQEAEAAIQRFNIIMKQAASEIVHPSGSVTVVGYNIGGSYSIGKDESPQVEILKGLGFNIATLPDAFKKNITRSSDFDFISHENLSVAITGKTVFLMRGTEDDVAAFMADPVLQNLESVKNGQVYPLGLTSFRIDYYSGLEMINQIIKNYSRQ